MITLHENEPLQFKVFFTLMIYSGFRRGEMLGLEWKDVDFDNNIISIRRTSNYLKKLEHTLIQRKQNVHKEHLNFQIQLWNC